MKGISCIGHLSGPSDCKDSGVWELQLRGAWKRGWRDGVRPGGTGKRARGRPLGRGDSLQESSPNPRTGGEAGLEGS